MIACHDMTEVDPGVWVREPTLASSSHEIKARYLDQESILKNDRAHYQRLRSIPQLSPLWRRPFAKAVDIGGGHPKLASMLNVDTIDVYDIQAEDYKKTHRSFKSIYPCGEVNYISADILKVKEWSGNGVAICSHILEHLTPRQIRHLLSKIRMQSLLVYGPNVERCTGDKWIHGGEKVPDHVTFMTLDAMKRVMLEFGFISRIAGRFADDYLIFASRDRQWKWGWE